MHRIAESVVELLRPITLVGLLLIVFRMIPEDSGTSKTYNTRRSVVDSLPYDSRGYLQIDNEPFEDDGGEDYVPPVNDEESDIEDVRLGKRIPIEKEVEVDSDEEEDLLTEVENTTIG
ncbi:hypothetical protein QE152_g12640 [Popillia japonica]|uniref:Uncharacterized protein n=1 Tax=Popillia japonica TaxID=7064 RepID=A0AAW1LQX3_POPJA